MNEHVVEAGPLAGLQHGLHLPIGVSYWPPAPLWWLLALILVVLVCWLTQRLFRKSGTRLFGRASSQAAESLAQTTQRLLQQCYAQWQKDAVGTAYLEQANVLLKRYVLSNNSASHQKNNEHLPTTWHGKPWVEWMQQSTPTNLSQITSQSLAEDCYRSEATLAAVPVAEIHQQLLQWISDYDEQHYA